MIRPDTNAHTLPYGELLVNFTRATKELMHRLHENNAQIPIDAVPDLENVRQWVKVIEHIRIPMPPKFQANGEPWNDTPGGINLVNP